MAGVASPVQGSRLGGSREVALACLLGFSRPCCQEECEMLMLYFALQLTWLTFLVANSEIKPTSHDQENTIQVL